MRIVSLLPSATEVVYALGLDDQLVAVTHECDYPAAALQKPRITRSLIPAGAAGAEIDRLVREQLHSSGTLYKLDLELLKRSKPDLILTQQLCDVCAVSYGSVARAAAALDPPPRIVNFEPQSVNDIFENIVQVGDLTGKAKEAERFVAALRRRVERVADTARNAPRKPRVVCLEWLDPPFCAGHWMPELVALAGASDPLGEPGKDSRRISWEDVRATDPDVIAVMCCGLGAERAMREAEALQSQPVWNALRAVNNGCVAYTDGNSYFSRPGPRIVESIEILATIVHPDLFPEPTPKGAVIYPAGTDRHAHV